MNNIKHTPGPWFMEPPYGRPPKIRIGEQNGAGTMICIVGNTNIRESNIIANARLIAAAPDLLSACERMVKFAHSHLGMYSTATIQGVICDMDQAIDKAKGNP